MKKNLQNGMTALEVIIVIIIFIIITSAVLAQFSKLKEAQSLKSATSEIISAIARAQTETLGSVDSSEYGVHFQSDKVIIFKGTTYSSGSSSNETILISSPVSISNVTLGGVSGVSGDMYFNRLYGVPSATGTVTVSTSSTSKIITISATGQASLN